MEDPQTRQLSHAHLPCSSFALLNISAFVRSPTAVSSVKLLEKERLLLLFRLIELHQFFLWFWNVGKTTRSGYSTPNGL